MDSTLAKRRFSSMDNDGREEKRAKEIAEIESSASVEDRSVQVDSEWFKAFEKQTRTAAMPRIPRPQGPTVLITPTSHKLLSEWYTQVPVKFCVVGGDARDTILADPGTKIGSLLPDIDPLDLYTGPTSSATASLDALPQMLPLDPATIVDDLGRIIIVNHKVSGTRGLTNLGNTCYMNSSLQCLAHVKELAAYFLSGDYRAEINHENPIGYGGAAAEAFGNLMNALYNSDATAAFTPSLFKATVGRFNRSFAGYLQQDSQEFTAFLLDALHEDLNRIRNKPATEKPELPDDKVHDAAAIAKLADECWELHRKRNDSVVLDLFTGLYKSTLVCPVCSKVSITFDPFGDLTLPFPSLNIWVHSIYYLGLDGTLLKFDIALQTHSSIAQLKGQVLEVLKSKCEHQPLQLAVAEIHDSKIWQWLGDRDAVGDKIGADDTIVVYQVAEGAHPVLCESSYLYFGIPFMVVLPKDATLEEVRAALKAQAAHLFGELVPFEILKQPRSYSDEVVIYPRNTASLEVEPEIDREEPEIIEITSPVSEEEPFECIPAPQPPASELGESEREQEQEEQAMDVESPSDAEAIGDASAAASTAAPIGPHDMLVCKFESSLTLKDADLMENPRAVEAQEKRKTKDLSLDDCLELFSQPEVLGENDLWYCNKCKEFRNATKKIELWQTPDIFTIHLKRFRDIHSSRDKINDVVDFPIRGLDMTKKVLGSNGKTQIYDLFAVDNHFGGLGGGHYTAFAQNPIDEKWYYFNDSRVTEADPEDSVNGAAYLLFYRRRSERLGNLSTDFAQVIEQTVATARQKLRNEVQSAAERRQQQAAVSAINTPPDSPEPVAANGSFHDEGHRLGGGSGAVAPATATWQRSSFLDRKNSDASSSTISDLST